MKRSDLKTIWQMPVYLPCLQPALTDETIQPAEKIIGYKLPQGYIELLKIQNGGYIRFTLPNTAHSEIYGIGPYFPSLTDFDWEDYRDSVTIQLNGLIPFDGDGHWYFCLDYRKSPNEPQITYIDTECDTEELVAENFEEYLSLLELSAENEYVLETNLSALLLIAQIEAALEIKFEEPDYFAHGYPIYRGRFAGGWVWLSPNTVKKGFIRENEARYNELKPLMEGTALRYPEIAGEYF